MAGRPKRSVTPEYAIILKYSVSRQCHGQLRSMSSSISHLLDYFALGRLDEKEPVLSVWVAKKEDQN